MPKKKEETDEEEMEVEEEEVPEPPKPPKKTVKKDIEVMSVPVEFKNKLVKHENNSDEDHVMDDEEKWEYLFNELSAIKKAIVG